MQVNPTFINIFEKLDYYIYNYYSDYMWLFAEGYMWFTAESILRIELLIYRIDFTDLTMSRKSFQLQTALFMNKKHVKIFLKSKFGCCSIFVTVSGQYYRNKLHLH